MARIIVLDSAPLGLACSRPGSTAVDDCHAWLTALESAGALVLIPAVVDYEVRRELIRLSARTKLRNLDALVARFPIVPVVQAAWLLAAELWAFVRRAGLPTADPSALDADCILAAQASLVGGSGDSVVIATTNVGHLGRFPGVVAEVWDQIVP